VLPRHPSTGRRSCAASSTRHYWRSVGWTASRPCWDTSLFLYMYVRQACLRPRERFWDTPVPKIDSAFDNSLVPQPSWSLSAALGGLLCFPSGARHAGKTVRPRGYWGPPALASLSMAGSVGKPCTGEPYARFDEGGQVNVTMIKLSRHRQTKGTPTDRFNLRRGKPALYSTHLFKIQKCQITVRNALAAHVERCCGGICWRRNSGRNRHARLCPNCRHSATKTRNTRMVFQETP